MATKMSISIALLALFVAASMQMPNYGGGSRVKREDEPKEEKPTKEEDPNKEELNKEVPNNKTPNKEGLDKVTPNKEVESSSGIGFFGIGDGGFPAIPGQEIFQKYIKQGSDNVPFISIIKKYTSAGNK